MADQEQWTRFRVLPNVDTNAHKFPLQVVDYGTAPMPGPLQGGRRMSLHERDEEAWEVAGALNYLQGDTPMARLDRAAKALTADLPGDKEAAVAFALELARSVVRAADSLEQLAAGSHNFGRGI